MCSFHVLYTLLLAVCTTTSGFQQHHYTAVSIWHAYTVWWPSGGAHQAALPHVFLHRHVCWLLGVNVCKGGSGRAICTVCCIAAVLLQGLQRKRQQQQLLLCTLTPSGHQISPWLLWDLLLVLLLLLLVLLLLLLPLLLLLATNLGAPFATVCLGPYHYLLAFDDTHAVVKLNIL